MSVKLQIEGMSDCMRWCDAAPKDMIKLAKKAMRSGAREASKYVKGRLEPRWRRMLRYVVEGSKTDEDLNCIFGLFNRHERSGSGKVDDWFKVYWQNYGTLLGRDPKHQFKNRIKPTRYAAASRRRNRYGIPYDNFFDDAMQGYENPFFRSFAKYVADNIEDCYER